MIRRITPLLLAAGVMAASTPTVPSLTLFTKEGSTTYSLPNIASLTFNDGASAIHKVRSEFCGFRLTGMGGGLANFSLMGSPGTMANLQLVDLHGRNVWTGSARLDATGKAQLQGPTTSGRLLIARYRNESVVQAAPVAMVNGGTH